MFLVSTFAAVEVMKQLNEIVTIKNQNVSSVESIEVVL